MTSFSSGSLSGAAPPRRRSRQSRAETRQIPLPCCSLSCRPQSRAPVARTRDENARAYTAHRPRHESRPGPPGPPACCQRATQRRPPRHQANKAPSLQRQSPPAPPPPRHSHDTRAAAAVQPHPPHPTGPPPRPAAHRRQAPASRVARLSGCGRRGAQTRQEAHRARSLENSSCRRCQRPEARAAPWRASCSARPAAPSYPRPTPASRAPFQGRIAGRDRVCARRASTRHPGTTHHAPQLPRSELRVGSCQDRPSHGAQPCAA